MRRQLPFKYKAIKLEINWPIGIKAVFIPTIIPRFEFGLISDKYIGTAIDDIPMPNPIMNLPNISKWIVGAKAMRRAPIVKSRSARIMIPFRPYLSQTGPVTRHERKAPKSAIETTNSV